MRKRSGNIKTRPYDDHMPPELLSKALELRIAPTGKRHFVSTTTHAGRLCYSYPWSDLELGDYFIVTIGKRSEQALRVAFAHAAARHDYELAVARVPDAQGHPALRVTLTVIDVTQWKLKAEKAGAKGIRYSSGKWSDRKKRWERKKRQQSSPPAAPDEPEKLSNPFWKDNEPVIPEQPEPEVLTRHLTREEMIKRALGEDA